MNRVVLVGNLTRDPDLRATSGGVSVCTFTVAVRRRISREAQNQGVQDADFIPVVVWRGQADSCAKYLTKGSKVSVCGSISTRSYTANDGTKRYVTEVVADEVEFLNAGGASAQVREEVPHPANSMPSFDDGIQPVDEEELPF